MLLLRSYFNSFILEIPKDFFDLAIFSFRDWYRYIIKKLYFVSRYINDAAKVYDICDSDTSKSIVLCE